MEELIRKKDAIDALTTYIYNVYKAMEGKRMPTDKCRQAAESVLGELPTVQPKHGKWEYHSNPNIGVDLESAYCSCCGFYVDTTGNIDFDEYNYCPHCGADMRGEQDE